MRIVEAIFGALARESVSAVWGVGVRAHRVEKEGLGDVTWCFRVEVLNLC